MSTDQVISGVSPDNPFYENYKPGQPLVEVKIPELPKLPTLPDGTQRDEPREVKPFVVTDLSPDSPITWEVEDEAPKVLTEPETSSVTTSTQEPTEQEPTGSAEPSVQTIPSTPSEPTTVAIPSIPNLESSSTQTS